MTLAALTAFSAHAGGQPITVPPAADVPPQNAPPTGVDHSYLHAEHVGGSRYRVVITAPADQPLYLSNCNGQMMWSVVLPEGGYPPNWEPRPVDACQGPSSVVEAGSSRVFEVPLGRRANDDSPRRRVHIVLSGISTTPYDHPGAETVVPLDKARSNLVPW